MDKHDSMAGEIILLESRVFIWKVFEVVLKLFGENVNVVAPIDSGAILTDLQPNSHFL